MATATQEAAKTCRLCNRYQRLSDFPRRRDEPGGRSPVCRSCADELNAPGAPPRSSAARLDRTHWHLPDGAVVTQADALVFRDANGVVRLALGLDANGDAAIRMFDSRGVEI